MRQTDPATATAWAKLQRVLPPDLAARARALVASESLVPVDETPSVAMEIVAAVNAAVSAGRRVTLRYRSRRGEVSELGSRSVWGWCMMATVDLIGGTAICAPHSGSFASIASATSCCVTRPLCDRSDSTPGPRSNGPSRACPGNGRCRCGSRQRWRRLARVSAAGGTLTSNPPASCFTCTPPISIGWHGTSPEPGSLSGSGAAGPATMRSVATPRRS